MCVCVCTMSTLVRRPFDVENHRGEIVFFNNKINVNAYMEEMRYIKIVHKTERESLNPFTHRHFDSWANGSKFKKHPTAV